MSTALRADEVIGIDLGTTNSCVAVMEGKVRGRGLRHPQPACVRACRVVARLP